MTGIMTDEPTPAPESSAVRVALWRAMHVEIDARHASGAMLARTYFADRTDGFRPPNSAEELLVATAYAVTARALIPDAERQRDLLENKQRSAGITALIKILVRLREDDDRNRR